MDAQKAQALSHHPGRMVRRIIDGLGLNVSEASKALGVTRPALSNLINGNAALSSEMAIRLEKAFGVPMEDLIRLQCTYEIALARQKRDGVLVQPYSGRLPKETQPRFI